MLLALMNSHCLLGEVFVFAVVGILATGTHFFSAFFFVENEWATVYIANFLGYVCAVFVSFFGHGIFTFKVRLSHHILLRFLIVSVANFACSELALFLSESEFHLPHELSLLVAVLIIPIISFVINKLWVYRPHS
jgi:putative flippase GtrA